jgi:hypothetical protein
MLNFRHITLLLPPWRNSPPEALEVLVECDNRTSGSARVTDSVIAWALVASRLAQKQASRWLVIRQGKPGLCRPQTEMPLARLT